MKIIALLAFASGWFIFVSNLPAPTDADFNRCCAILMMLGGVCFGLQDVENKTRK